MNSEFINVHEYDSKLVNSFKPSKEYSLEEKKHLILILIKQLTKEESLNMVNIIYNDMLKENNGENYQEENKIDCTDVLANILDKEYIELLPLIEEQLIDMFKLGKCPSGRVTRLLQVWNTLN